MTIKNSAMLPEHLKGLSVLWLPLKRDAFDITGTPEKPFEYRNKSHWIDSRLRTKEGAWRKYDLVGLHNGYQSYCPVKIFRFITAIEIEEQRKLIFSNGLEFWLSRGDYAISLGDLIWTSNLDKAEKDAHKNLTLSDYLTVIGQKG